ncbi:MAG: hypothetical protein P8X64_09050 [Anaerolineales bacterium]
MGLKPDHWIAKMARKERMIEPFEEGQVRLGVFSYGVSSYGYDIIVAYEFYLRAHALRRKVDLRPLRHHRQRDALRTRVGGVRDP